MTKFADILTKDFLTEELVKKERYVHELAREVGCCAHSIYKYLKKFNVPIKRGKRLEKSDNLIGNRYNKLLVLSRVDNDKFGKTKWKCQCDCGNEINVNGASLKRKLTKSCGCYKEEKGRKGYEDISQAFWNKLKRNALKRGYIFEISMKYAWELFLKQDRKCALSKVFLKFAPNYDKCIEQTASLDRIDSTKGYIEGNVQWVHKRINRVKNVLDNDELLFWSKLIYINNKKIADKIVLNTDQIGWNWNGCNEISY